MEKPLNEAKYYFEYRKKLIQKAKFIAAKNNSSISQLLSEKLEKEVHAFEKYESAKIRAIHNLKSGFHFGGQIHLCKEALHVRNGIKTTEGPENAEVFLVFYVLSVSSVVNNIRTIFTNQRT